MSVVLLSILVSLLPSRYRGHWLGDGNLDVRRGAILSAVVQFFACCIALWAFYPAFIQARLEEASRVAAAAHPGDRVVESFTVFIYGQFAAIEYIFRPLTLILVYFAIEGAVRLFSAVGSDIVVPTLPLQLVAWMHDLLNVRYEEFKLGPRIPDALEPGLEGKYDLKVESCRPKHWNSIITIRYDDILYELQSEEAGVAPRPFVYLLKKMPSDKVLRGWRNYDPEEVVRE